MRVILSFAQSKDCENDEKLINFLLPDFYTPLCSVELKLQPLEPTS